MFELNLGQALERAIPTRSKSRLNLNLAIDHLRKQSYKTVKVKAKVNKNKWLFKINFYKEIQLLVPRANPVSSELVQGFFFLSKT